MNSSFKCHIILHESAYRKKITSNNNFCSFNIEIAIFKLKKTFSLVHSKIKTDLNSILQMN